MIFFNVHFYLLEYLKCFQCMTWILEKSKAHSYTFNISMICEKYSHNSNLHPRFPQFMDMLETSLSFYNRNLVGSHLLRKHRLDELISVTRSNRSIFLDITTILPRQLTYLGKNAAWKIFFWNGTFSREEIVHFLGGEPQSLYRLVGKKVSLSLIEGPWWLTPLNRNLFLGGWWH